ncbi:MFS transporter [Fimbriimonas ginsengisoli]|uniref:MFS transporter n=1 Tax=Fimbriimonas ginsengisoli TaxID=1005039 RepID=UPI00118700A7|nr:MFS transporter [Fimbriimonas ginsengisoli]
MAFATAFGTLVSGLFLVGFIQSLGGSDVWIGFLSGIPSLIGLLQIPGAIWGRRFSSYKRFVLPGGLFWRLGYVPLVVLPFLPAPPALKLTLLLTCVLLASVGGTLVNPVYNEWIAEMVPDNSRGTFFARRNAIATAVGAVVGIFGALLLDAFRGHHEDKTGFTVVYGLGIVCAFVSMYFFTRMQDLPREAPVRQGLAEGLRTIGQPFGDRNYRRVLIFLGVAVLGQAFAGNLFNAYALESLKLDFKVVQGTAVSMAIGNVLSARFWGFLSDKYGNKPVLAIVATLLALNPIAWLATIPGQGTYNAVLLLSTHVLMGMTWCGINLCQFNIMLATAKPAERASYIGAGMTITALLGGISPLLGAFMMAGLRFGFPAVVAYKLVFLVSILLRFAAVLFLIPINEQGSTNLRTALGALRRVTPRGMKAMRSLAKSSDVEARAEAIHSVGATGATLAADEVIKALHDPQPKIRRQAAEAIARLNHPRATQELIHQVEEHPDLLEEETIEALGRVGDARAVPVLIQTLQSPRSLLRRAAARALGRVGEGDEVTIGALIRAAEDPDDVDLRRTALQSLRRLEVREAEPVIRNAIGDPHPSVRIAAAEAIAELDLSDAAPALRASMEKYRDEASSEAAYALGVVGDSGDIPLILDEAARSVSMITRRRCLLGVARLLGVEREAYRLMLLDGMARDAALLQILGPEMKRRPKIRSALTRFSSGDEVGAVEALVRSWKVVPPGLDQPPAVEELFLVLAVATTWSR